MSPYASYVLETFVTLLLVCGLAFFLLWGARRMGIGRASGPIRLCAQLPLDRRRAIYVVKVGDQAFVLGVGEAGFTKIGEMPASALPPESEASSAPFADVLAKLLGRRGRGDGDVEAD